MHATPEPTQFPTASQPHPVSTGRPVSTGHPVNASRSSETSHPLSTSRPRGTSRIAEAGGSPARSQLPPPNHNHLLGAWGEAFAAGYLSAQGFSLLARNWRTRHGELDLVMREGATVVAVEVKTRTGTGYGTPLEAVTARKAARLRRLLLEWARQSRAQAAPLRVDAFGITVRPNGGAPHVQHLRAIS